jgi:predicted alpha/beta hydrolase
MQVAVGGGSRHLIRKEATMTEPTSIDLSLTTDDGVTLSARIHEPEAPRAQVIVHGATAVPRRYYDRFARWLAGRGYRVLTYDYRGIGGSRPRSLVGFPATMRDWAERDAVAALAALRARDPSLPVMMVGHSFGGQALGLSEALHEVRAAVMVGTQFGYFGHWDPLARLRMRGVWSGLLPLSLGLFGYWPGWTGIGEDLPAGVAREWGTWCTSPGYLTDHVPGASARFARFEAPVLFYSFTDDDFAPRGAVQAYLDALPSGSVVHRRLEPGDVGARAVGHFGFFRPAHEATLWSEVARAFDDVLAGNAISVRASVPPGEVAALALTLGDGDLAVDLAYGRD